MPSPSHAQERVGPSLSPWGRGVLGSLSPWGRGKEEPLGDGRVRGGWDERSRASRALTLPRFAWAPPSPPGGRGVCLADQEAG
ncbi:hypothetical protein SPHINGOT1_240016 [Sphingomonas sp. T1]|nr:hypothetical protein SPHINGOT1_240016 [Sphingomonas sp. T1]